MSSVSDLVDKAGIGTGRGHESCFISSGEVSADVIGADLVRKLKLKYPDMDLYGIGGEAMIASGLRSIVDQKQLRFMGFWDAFTNLSKIRKILIQVIKAIEARGTKFVVLIDYPGFHFKLASELKKRGIKVFQYISPKVWAWGSWRIKKMERFFDAVFGVFPFEIDYFKNTAVNYIYVGSFHKKRIDSFLKEYKGFELGIKTQYKLAVLPGSRKREFEENFPVMWKIFKQLKNKIEVSAIIPVASGFEVEDILRYLPESEQKELKLREESRDGLSFVADRELGVYFVKGHSLEVLRSCDSGLVVEGTATLETALIKTPFAAIYNPGKVLTFIGKRVLKISMIGLNNIVRGKPVTKDFVKYYTVDEVVEELFKLSTDTEYRSWMIAEFEKLADILDTPSIDIVEAIDKLI